MKNCPKCGVSLEGGSIWETFFEKYGSEQEATRVAEMYGATKENNLQWGRQIGIYDLNTDRTVSWRCPDCNHEWPR